MTILVILHILVAVFLVLVVLVQQSGADMGTAFGGSSSSVLGASGGNKFMTRATSIVAAVFMLTSIGLTMLRSDRGGSSVVDEVPVEETIPAARVPEAAEPAAPAGEAGEQTAAEGEGEASAGEAAPAAEEPAAEEAPAAQ